MPEDIPRFRNVGMSGSSRRVIQEVSCICKRLTVRRLESITRWAVNSYTPTSVLRESWLGYDPELWTLNRVLMYNNPYQSDSHSGP